MSWLLPLNLLDAPVLRLGTAALDDVELLVNGGFSPLEGFLGREDARCVRAKSQLLDGRPWPVPLVLPVPAGTALVAQAQGLLVLQDEEATPVALVRVHEVWHEDGASFVGGHTSALRPFERGPARELRRTPAELRDQFGDDVVLGVPVAAALDRATTAAIDEAAAVCGARRVLLLPCVGKREPADLAAAPLIRATCAAAEDLTHEALVVPVPLREHGEAELDRQLQLRVALAHGATRVATTRSLDTGAGLSPSVIVVLPRVQPQPDAPRWHPGVARELALAREQEAGAVHQQGRGVTVFLTGLSGSGKSTIARALHEYLVERTGRTASLLDGDVVRQLLSSGLGFSRTDRELNVARIGFVAAEVTRHGGIAVCAPIAPFATGRDEVRRRVSAVGDFMLIHVSTPLEVCEARDRKGLYAKARAGHLPEFTGISSPYENPADAALRLDTSTLSTSEAVQQIVQLLQTSGHLPATTGVC